jgi:hypothetical protein
MKNIGQYAMVSYERTLDFGGRKFCVALYGAYNAFGLIGSEKNGICVLDLDRTSVVLDGHSPEDSGYYGPSEAQVVEWERICSMSQEEFFMFCNGHQNLREPVEARKVSPKSRFNAAKYISVAAAPVAYNERAKSEFLRMGRQLAIILANKMGLNEDQYDVRVNKAGIAVSGEVTLHTDTHYIQLGQSSSSGFLVRSCKGRKDYTGGCNHYVKWESLRDLDKVAEFILSLS